MNLHRTGRRGFLGATAISLMMAAGAAAASERQLISGDGLYVLAPNDWCAESIDISIVSEDAETHYAGSLVEVQKLLGGLRAVLPFECPQVSEIRFTAKDDGRTPLLEGSISEADGWRLTEVWEVEPPVQVAEAETDFINEEVVVRKRDEAPPSPAAADDAAIVTWTNDQATSLTDDPDVVVWSKNQTAGAAEDPDVVTWTKEEGIRAHAADAGTDIVTWTNENPNNAPAPVAEAPPAPEAAEAPRTGEVAVATNETAEAASAVGSDLMAQPDTAEPGEEVIARLPETPDPDLLPKEVDPEAVEAAAEGAMSIQLAEAPEADESYEEALRRLWEEAEHDYSDAKGDLIGTWRSPSACISSYSSYESRPYVTASVYHQEGTTVSVVLSREVVDGRFPDINDPSGDPALPLSQSYVGMFEGDVQGDGHVLRLRKNFSQGSQTGDHSKIGREGHANLNVRFVEELPADFSPNSSSCAATLVKINNDVTLAEGAFQLYQFAHLLSDYLSLPENGVRNDVLGLASGSGFRLPTCEQLVDYSTKYPESDRILVGTYQLYRHFNDDDHIATFGVPVTALTAEQRTSIGKFARSCRKEGFQSATILFDAFRSSTWRRLDNMLEDEAFLTTLPLRDIMGSYSDPIYTMFAVNNATVEGLSTGRVFLGTEYDRRLGKLTAFHKEQVDERNEALSKIIIPAAAQMLAHRFSMSELAQRRLLAQLERVESHANHPQVAEVREEVATRVAKMVDERIAQQAERVANLQVDRSSSRLIDEITEAVKEDLRVASREQAAAFNETVAGKRAEIRAAVMSKDEARMADLLDQLAQLPIDISSLDELPRIEAEANSLTVSPNARGEFKKTFEEISSNFEAQIVSGALADLSDLEEAVAALTLNGEGFQELLEVHAVGMAKAEEFDDARFKSLLRESGDLQNYQSRLRSVARDINAMPDKIHRAVQDDLTRQVQERGLPAWHEIQEMKEREFSLIGNPEGWIERTDRRLQMALVEWMKANPEETADVMRGDEQAFELALATFQELSPYFTPDAVSDAIADAYEDEIHAFVLEELGLDLGKELSADDVMTASLARSWTSHLEEVIKRGMSKPFLDAAVESVVRAERQALADIVQQHADHLYRAIDKKLDDRQMSEDDYVHALHLGTKRQASIPVIYLTDVGFGFRGELLEPTPEKRARLAAGSRSTWSYWGYPEAEEAVAELNREYASRLLQMILDNPDDHPLFQAVKEDIQAALEGEVLQEVYQEYLEAKDTFLEEARANLVEEVVPAAVQVHDLIMAATLEGICAGPIEQSGLSSKDREHMLLSSGGVGESLGMITCRAAMEGAKILKYEGPGLFSSDHKLTFETKEGDVLTATLVEAEVRPGEKLLVGVSMKDPTSEWKITAAEWRQQVEALVQE